MHSSSSKKTHVLRTWLAASVAALALLGCGGGGDGGASSPAVQILDSFGEVVAAGGADGVGVGDAGADGTAGEGAPIVAGKVEVTDVAGRTVSSITDSQGYYRAKVTGFTPPLVAKVTKADGKVLHSLNVTPLKVNGFVTVNITGLTDKVASDVARAGGKSGAAELTPQIVAAQSAAIAQSVESLRTQIAPVINAAGIALSSFDPLSAPFRPNRTGYDFVLDNVKVTVAADGSTQVALAPTFGLSGTWQLKLDEDDFVVGQVAGAKVPTAEQLATQTPGAVIAQVFGIDAPNNQYTFTTNGDTVTMTGPNTNFQIVVHNLTYSAYQSCGSCGVGSQVSFVVTATLSEAGVLNGATVRNADNFTQNYTFHYTRLN